MVLRIGVIGLGDIARKAYLPVLAAERGVELHLHTRTRATLDRVGDQYRTPHRHASLDALIEDGGLDGAFVHAPTEQHVAITERLLDAGIHVYVDKPLDYRVEGAERLVRLAGQRGRTLMVGFNRRYAPGYTQALDHPRDLVLLRKNRVGLAAEPRRVVFDDFIHVVDTLRFLLPGDADHFDVRAKVRDGLLHHVVLNLSGDGFTALGVMNRMSGSAEESLEVSGQDTKREIVNLAEIIDHKGQPSVRRRGDWVPVARQRGFEQAGRAFLDAVRTDKVLSVEDALKTHQMCERVVSAIEESAAL